jgi:uncharacterized membrane protein YfcA
VRTAFFIALGAFSLWYVITVFMAWQRKRTAEGQTASAPTPATLGIGFVTNFFDTLGIGSFAPTTSIFRAFRIVPDELIPGTLNIGHCLPVIAQAFLFTTAVPVETMTLVSMILAAVAGAWLGAGVVSSLPRRSIQVSMGGLLLMFALLLTASQLKLLPVGGEALGVSGMKLVIAIVGNFVLGAIMTLGIGLYAPCMVLVSLLGMNVTAAFPIMMGSCAFLMPVSSAKFVRTGRFDIKAALGLAIGGVPAVLLAFYVVKSLPLYVLQWVVVGVVTYTAIMLLRSALRTAGAAAPSEGRAVA